ncbi:gag-pol polyprotein [Tanacetum coccineum]
MKAILRKDKCLAVIGERPAEVTDDSKWDEMDGNAIAKLHLALADGVLSSIKEKKTAMEIWDHLARLYKARTLHNKKFLKRKLYALRMTESTSVTEQVNNLNTLFSQLTSLDYCLVFDDVAASVLEEENRRNNRDGQYKLQSKDRWLMIMKLKIIGIDSVRVEDARMVRSYYWDVRHVEGLTKESIVSWQRDDLGFRCHRVASFLALSESLDICRNKRNEDLVVRKANSWRCWVYPIKKKSNVFEVFKVYKARVELDYGKKIKCLRTDNGGHYTHHQIRVAERNEKTLFKRARAMLATASLGKSFWAEAVNTTYLHIFGSLVYVMYNTQETTKLDPKSRKCLFLGYADGVKGYRLWDPTAHKVVVSRDVVFMEDKIQENKEGDSTTRETTSIQMEKEFQSNDSFEAAPQHEVNETNESQAPATRTLNRERRRPGWHSDYVMESNVAYCLLTEEGEPSTLQEALNNPDASFWKEAMQEEIKALHKNKT